jgi:UDP-N-acetylglucosamine acyltransferase
MTVIHPTAIVDRRAEIAEGVDVGPFCVIDAQVRIGRGCRLYQGVYVTGWTEIGEGCILHPGVIVGHEPQDTKYHGERTYCRIGSRTVIREYVTIHRGTTPESRTEIGEDCFLLAGCHVGHNCSVGNQVTIINDVLLAGHVEVGDRVTIGGGGDIHQFVRIGELAMVAGHARVVLDVPPFALTDEAGRVAGLNRVGLRRAGVPSDESAELRRAYRVLFAHGRPFTERIEQIRSLVSSPPGRRLLAFLESPTRRGLAGRARGSHRDTDAGATDA